ncbi:hypothetical protein [Streptomyces sp. SPB162]|uniref:hypothetical protein n=1 Tax=Streptomyces sp. SPB162 TaxID=2940560 RepID=UPI002405D1F8|nr:hypothetical protein [Streptomyces sp. SPB162]MDF9812906.1 hypothetical protein [Streptomyces sp. SPB162]
MEPEGELGQEPGVVTAAARSAERQIALAATEGFHPLRVRPYVAEPGTEGAESTVKPLIGPGVARPAATDVGMFPADNLEYPADDDAGLPADDGRTEPADPHDSGLLLARTGGSDWDDADGPGPHRGGRRRRPRRRGRGMVVAAATVAATAMAAGAVARRQPAAELAGTAGAGPAGQQQQRAGRGAAHE